MSHTEVTDLEIMRCMEQRGGSFMRALANAAMYADGRNLERLKLAFDDYWTTYREMAKAMKEQTNEPDAKEESGLCSGRQ